MKEVLDYGVLGFLLFLSVVVVGIVLERIWFYATMRVSDYEDKRLLELDLHKRLTLVATIGSNAPYVGLLGTVGGIMMTFADLGQVGDTQSIMLGLSLALKATAAGLMVAIPAIVSYNLLLRKAEVILCHWDIYHHPDKSDQA
ncbi:TonB-system energizer ExbB [Helicobacter enhydrae]|uniref:TonB-system energizer ExbB n=1 Tax=Helicobacter enhydrae TaxID=222136 RepID=A0A1B1U4E4_9HELI|nr:TonB-system energizer ExbB [Helicobacter enhydrae]ANV97630.1 TonB-system energizer ExbB [Helicobacter enhydrae]